MCTYIYHTSTIFTCTEFYTGAHIIVITLCMEVPCLICHVLIMIRHRPPFDNSSITLILCTSRLSTMFCLYSALFKQCWGDPSQLKFSLSIISFHGTKLEMSLAMVWAYNIITNYSCYYVLIDKIDLPYVQK